MKYRSNEQELMDDPKLSSALLAEALQDISRANRLLGGNSITLNATYQLILQERKQKHFTIVDVGCGDGTQLRELAIFLRKKKISFSLIGVDINEKSLEIGRSMSTSFPEISFRNHDILQMTKEDIDCDIILTTLTLHHFTDQEILVFLQQFYKLCSIGIVINDLQRSRLAYVLFKIFSLFLIKGPVAKNDGLVSIQRGFKKIELHTFSKKLAFSRSTITWKWAFRYLWVILKIQD